MRTPHRRWLLIGLAAWLSACDTQADIEGTIPADGQNDVDPRSIVAIRLSTTMSGLDEDRNTDPRSIVVTGDQSDESYSGTIQAAPFREVFNGQTVEEFRQGFTAQPREGDTGSGDGDGGEGDQGSGGVDINQSENNTLVFLLDGDVQFKAGEVITIFVTESISVRSATMNDSLTFEFLVGGGASQAEGDFFVASTHPAKESSNVDLKPTVTATFSQEAQATGIPDAVSIRGRHSGFHADFATSAGTGTSLDVLHQLAPQDTFLPGETVSVTWNARIDGPGGAALSPFLLSFQVKPGKVNGLLQGEDGWDEVAVDADIGKVLALLPGNYLGPVEDLSGDRTEFVEFLAVTSRRLRLYGQRARDGKPELVEDVAVDVAGTIRAAVSLDTDDDGVPEVVLVVETVDGGQLVEYDVTESDDGRKIDIEPTGDPVDFPAGDILGALVADLDVDGIPELIVTHGDTTFEPEAPATPRLDGGGGEGGEAETPVLLPVDTETSGPQNTGLITFFELADSLATGDGEMPNIADLLEQIADPLAAPRLTFRRVDRPIPRFEEVSRLETHDLDGDGRLDLLAQSSEGLLLYRNQTTEELGFGFRRIGFLAGRGGGPVEPDAWLAVDIDRDGDIDVVSWDGSGALLHENHQPSRDSDRGSGDQNPRGILFEDLPPEPFAIRTEVGRGDKVLASNIDGDDDGVPDLIVLRSNGTAEILIGSADAVSAFEEPREFPASGGLAASALTDVNGDDGLDLVVHSGDRLRALVTDPALVDRLPRRLPSSFRLVEVDSNPDSGTGDDGEPRVLEPGDIIALEVRGDMVNLFSGFSVAVQFDDSAVEYREFVSSTDLESRSGDTVAACPTQPGQPCQGFEGAASVAASFQEPFVAKNDVLLGTFRFAVLNLETEAETTIELANFQSADQSLTNSVTVADADFSFDDPVSDLGESLLFLLGPAAAEPPARLEIDCTVEERRSDGTEARIEWRSPRMTPFSRVLIDIDGTQEFVDWRQGSVRRTLTSGGTIDVTLRALESEEDPEIAGPPDAEMTCSFVSILQPKNVVCTKLDEDAPDIEISWSLDHGVDNFRIYRNDEPSRIATVPTEGRRFVDTEPPERRGAHSYAVVGVISGIEGPPGTCRGPDPAPCNTAAPTAPVPLPLNRLQASSPNIVRFEWGNAEAYTRLAAELTLTSRDGLRETTLHDLDPNMTVFTFSGDVDRGGALPGSYELTLQGFVIDEDGSCGDPDGEIESPLVTSTGPVIVPVPSIERVSLTCTREGLGDLRVGWLRSVWHGYDELVLRVRHTLDDGAGDDIPDIPVLLSDREYVIENLEPVGSYDVSLVGKFGTEEESTTACRTVFEAPTVTTGDVDAGIGLSRFEIPIVASGIFRDVTDFELDLEYPDFVTIDDFSSVRLGSRRRRVSISVSDTDVTPDPDGDRQTNGDVVLIRLSARVDSDITTARSEEALVISNARVRLHGSADFQSIASSEDGKLFLRERYVVLDQAAVDVGSEDVVSVSVRVAFTAPTEAPDYKYQAFGVNLGFDPEELELVAIESGDAVADRGYNLLGFPEVDDVNESGTIGVFWAALFANPFDPPHLKPPGGELLVLSFRSRLAENAAETFSAITFDRERTAFEPLPRVSGVETIEAIFDGGILQRSSVPELRLGKVEPDKGALTGGNRIQLFGRGFPTDGSEAIAVEFESFSGEILPVDPETIEVVSSEELQVDVPDSGLRADTFFAVSRQFHVRVKASVVEATLERGYAYMSPRLLVGSNVTNVTSVHADGDDVVHIRGEGFALDVIPEFRFDGGQSVKIDNEDDILRREPDGTAVVFRARGIPGRLACEEADVFLVQTGVELQLPDRFLILPQSGECDGSVAEPVDFPFRRGDSDADGSIMVNDGTHVLNFLFNGGGEPNCEDAGDVNDDGSLSLDDAIHLFNYLFLGGAPPRPPLESCGEDPTAEPEGSRLDCRTESSCP